MPTKLTRLTEADWERLDRIRKGMVVRDGENRTMANAATVVLDRYEMTAEMIFELSKEMVLAAVKQSQERVDALHSPEFQQPVTERLGY